MLYLSKGIVCRNSTENNLYIAHGNNTFTLKGTEAKVWLDGRFKMCIFPNPNDYENAVLSLFSKGLAEFEHNSETVDQYRLLSRCICSPTKAKRFHKPLKNDEKKILKWLCEAGIRLTTAELIYLFENKIAPTPSLLFEENRQALIETIYTKNNIHDNILETQMEHSRCRDKVITVLLTLLQKKRIVIL